MSRGTIAVAGALAQRPRRGGHTWVFLQYLLGFRRLGWDVLFIDRLEPGMAGDPDYLSATMTAFGIDYVLLGDGAPHSALIRRLRDAAFLLNVMGYLEDEDLLGAARRRVFLDIDPGFTQMWRALELADVTRGHDVFVTVGENVGTGVSSIPSAGIRWLTTRPPVVLAEWPVAQEPAAAITGIGSWRGPYGPLQFEGVDYGLRVHEFRRFADVPARCPDARFEYALEVDPSDARDAERLRLGGWRLLDPLVAAGTPTAYREFVQSSLAEIMVAKGIYVRSRSGWFSDRSACYLASGRPVIAQDTGRTQRYCEGLLTFATPEEAQGAVADILADYPRHRRAAREIAEAEFDSDHILETLTDQVLAA